MATRQNKKRKARNSMNRERTVTTLTEDPGTAFLVPTPSEDPPKSAVSIPAPFVGQGSNSGFQMPHSYPGFPNNYMSPISAPVGTPYQFYQQQQQQTMALPPGQNDLEILENLKDMIKNNQHEVFKPIPNPNALASIYLGTRNTSTGAVSQVPPHPEQIPQDAMGTPVMSHSNGVDPNSSTRPRSESWDRKPTPQTPVSATQIMANNATSLSKDRNEGIRPLKDMPSGGKPELPGARQDTPHGSHPSSQTRSDQTSSARSAPDRSFNSEAGSNARPERPASRLSGTNGKDDSRSDLKSSWVASHSRDDSRGRADAERPAPPPLSRPPSDRSGAGDSRGPPARDQRLYDRDRDRDRDSVRDREREREFDRDRRADNYRPRDDRRSDDRSRAPEPIGNGRRPPPEERHYEPRRSDPLPPRRFDTKPADEPMAVDRRPEPSAPPPRTSLPDDRAGRPPVPEDRQMRPPPPPGDDRAPSARGPPSQAVDARASVADSRAARPIDDRRVPPPSEDRNSGRPPLDNVRPDDRSSRAPIPVADSRPPPSRPPPVLEERSGRPPPPPLQDRIGGHPLPSRVPDDHAARAAPVPDKRPLGPPDDRSIRPPPPDDRLPRSVAPPLTDRDQPPSRTAPRPLDDTDRSRRLSVNDRGPPVDDRRDRPGPPPGGDRYRPSPPPVDRRPPPRASDPVPRRSSPAARSDVLVPKREPRSPSPRNLRPPPPRDYPPVPRDVSRERPDIRPAPRADIDRPPYDARRPDMMDVDSGPARYRRSPPPLRERSPARASWTRDPPPPLPTADADRRFTAEPRRDYYEDSRDWSYRDRDARDARDPRDPDWDRRGNAPPPPPAREYDRDRGFYAREPSPAPARAAYDRDRRPYSPPPVASSRVEPMRPLAGPRVADPYPEERAGYPPRDFDRPAFRDPSPPPISRVRPRSPSPLRRPGPADDLRPPPFKRARDEPYGASSAYYSPPRRDTLLSTAEYTSRAASPPRSISTSGYYDRPAYASSGPPPPRDSDYIRERPLRDADRYGSYDSRAPAPRSPPPYSSRAYPPADPRDDRRYMGPPGRL